MLVHFFSEAIERPLAVIQNFSLSS